MHPLELPRRPLAAGLVLAAGAGVAFAAAWGVDRSSAVAGDRGLQAVAVAAFIGAYVAIGAYTWWSGSPHGLLLVGVGLFRSPRVLVYWPHTVPTWRPRESAALIVYIIYVFLCFPRDVFRAGPNERSSGGFLVASLLVWQSPSRSPTGCPPPDHSSTAVVGGARRTQFSSWTRRAP